MNQNELTSYVDEQKQNIQSYNNQKIRLQADLQLLENEQQKLQQLIESVSTYINKIEMVGEFGYSRNLFNHLKEAISLLKVYLKSIDKNEELNKIYNVIRKISTIKRNTTEAELNNVVEEVAQINQTSNIAKKQVEGVVDELLQETLLYGGKLNNQRFMGTAKAQKVVDLLGSKKQQLESKHIKKITEQNSKQSFIKLETEKVIELRRGIETGSIFETLSKWDVAYRKHKKLDNYVPDKESESYYYSQVKAAQNNAAALHKKGCGALKNFIDEVIASVFNASFYSIDGSKNLKNQESLSQEYAEVLVFVYGNDEQYHQWNSKVIPSVRAC